jgi:hypothetical protein
MEPDLAPGHLARLLARIFNKDKHWNGTNRTQVCIKVSLLPLKVGVCFRAYPNALSFSPGRKPHPVECWQFARRIRRAADKHQTDQSNRNG